MRFCIVRNSSTGGRSRTLQGVTVDARRLTIGSAPNQQLQLTGPGIDEQHAILGRGLFGGLRINSLDPNGILINGRRSRASRLRSGDTVQIGSTKVSVRESRTERLWVLVVDEQPATAEYIAEQQDTVSGSAPVLRLASWSVSLVLVISVLFLILPMSSVYLPQLRNGLRSAQFLPSDNAWSPGSLHADHRSIGARCEACHAKPFQPVRNEECLACHKDVRRHVDLNTAHASTLDRERCTGCHLEHSQPNALLQRDQRMCGDCHTDLATLKPGTKVANVTDFDTDHPEFRVTALTAVATSADHWNWQARRLDRDKPAAFHEESHLHFSHRKHLDPAGIKSPEGERVLECHDCHIPDASGRYMRPIQMEAHCSSCHSLKFDEHDPSSAVPHGNLSALFRRLQEHFSSQYLSQQKGSPSSGPARLERPGESGHPLSASEEKRAREWVDSQTLRIARELLEKRVCADCHEVTRDDHTVGLQQWRIVPVRLTSRWMPRAQFDHTRHAGEKCTSCHQQAIESEESSDILMPQITRCRECHGGAAAAAKVSSDCVMCHSFHIPGRERWTQAEPLNAASTRDSQ